MQAVRIANKISAIASQEGELTDAQKEFLSKNAQSVSDAKIAKAQQDIDLYQQAQTGSRTLRTTFTPNDWRIKDVIDPYAIAKFKNRFNPDPVSQAFVESSLATIKETAIAKFGLTEDDFVNAKVDMTSLLKGETPTLPSEVTPITPVMTVTPTQVSAPTTLTAAITPTTLAASPSRTAAPISTSAGIYDPISGSQQAALYNQMLGIQNPSVAVSGPAMGMNTQGLALQGFPDQSSTPSVTSPVPYMNGVPYGQAASSALQASQVSEAYQNYLDNLYQSQLGGQYPVSTTAPQTYSLSMASPYSADISAYSSPYGAYSSLASPSVPSSMLSYLLSSGQIPYSLYNSLMSGSMASPYSQYSSNYPSDYSGSPSGYSGYYPGSGGNPTRKLPPALNYPRTYTPGGNPTRKLPPALNYPRTYTPDLLSVAFGIQKGNVTPANLGIGIRGLRTPEFIKNPA